MHRRAVLRRLAAAGATAGAGALADCPGGDGEESPTAPGTPNPSPGGPAFHEGFEDGLGDWEADATHYVDGVTVSLEAR